MDTGDLLFIKKVHNGYTIESRPYRAPTGLDCIAKDIPELLAVVEEIVTPEPARAARD